MTGTERKALNKYYPPDFDPRKIPKVRGPRNRQYVIRVMAPFNMKCNTCGEYIYKGKKFNARRETVEDDDYLGLYLFRFYIRCPGCLAEITFKTDLKSCDYAAEHGSTRLFEADKALKDMEKERERAEEEEKQNAMKQLEKRTKMSRVEMEALERLEELREIKQREGKVDYENIIAEVTKEQREQLERQERQDEEFVKRLFAKNPDVASETTTTSETARSSKVSSDNLRGGDTLISKDKPPPFKRAKLEWNQRKLLKGVVVAKTKRSTDPAASIEGDTETASTSAGTSTGVRSSLSLVGAYVSSSDEDSV